MDTRKIPALHYSLHAGENHGGTATITDVVFLHHMCTLTQANHKTYSEDVHEMNIYRYQQPPF